MAQRLRILGIVMVASGIFGFGVAGFTLVSTMNGMNALQAFSQDQAVKLSYNDQGQITDHGSTDSAQQILDLVTKDWGYKLNMADLNPNDPLVNTASEYMYQMGAISEHTLSGKTTVVLPADVTKQDGTVVKAGTYEFQNDGRYYSGFNYADPIESAARGQLWSGTALSLIGQLGVGAVTNSGPSGRIDFGASALSIAGAASTASAAVSSGGTASAVASVTGDSATVASAGFGSSVAAAASGGFGRFSMR